MGSKVEQERFRVCSETWKLLPETETETNSNYQSFTHLVDEFSRAKNRRTSKD